MSKDFLYGVSSSSFQIEGDDGKQGRGKSVWDVLCEQKGIVHNNDNAIIATDHYNRYKEDVKLISDLGANSYRFSTSWSRILPDGIGKINEQGVAFYDRLIDELLEKNITPMLTLYHWDLPQALQEKGGLFHTDFSKWFLEYAEIIAKKYGDRVEYYNTFNEPINCVHTSYHAGLFAPRLKLSMDDTLICLQNMWLGHGEAYDVLHTHNKKAKVGIAKSTFEEYPINDNPQTIEMAKKHYFSNFDGQRPDDETIEVYLDSLFFGKYPKYVLDKNKKFSEYVQKTGTKSYCRKIDFLGINTYSGSPIDENGCEVGHPQGTEYNAMGSALDENGLYWGVKFMNERYQVPIYITESGMASDDILQNGKVQDTMRSKLLIRNLQAVEKLRNENVDIRGYYVWSILDNFEWLLGYSKRFGLVYVDYNTLQRIPKESYYVYQKFLKDFKDAN